MLKNSLYKNHDVIQHTLLNEWKKNTNKVLLFI